MKNRTMTQLQAALLLAVLSVNPAPAAWPEKPTTVVAAFAPGGATDIAVRPVAQGPQDALGQPAVVQNKPGARVSPQARSRISIIQRAVLAPW